MEQHPVPQQISSYQFRLVGDMTLKQFFELAAGCIVGLLTYASSLPGLIKWPIIVISVLIGAAFAFLPLEERPLEVWFIAFFRSIYQPTLFYWKKLEPGVNFFTDDKASPLAATLPAVPATGIPPSTPKPVFEERLEQQQNETLAKINSVATNPSQPIVTPPTPQPPNPVTLPQRPEVVVPKVQDLTVPKTSPVYAAAVAPVVPAVQNFSTSQVKQTFTTSSAQGAASVSFSPDASPPMPPSEPNVIVGQVMDANKKIIEGAILEVKDNQGRPVRALRTNRAGHFLIVTPLSNGDYQLFVEKPGFVFNPVNFKAEGKKIEPIAVTANPLPYANQTT